MHQPYYQNLLTHEVSLPWVRLHGTKDYRDMVEILRKYPGIRLVFNLVPSLIEQIKAYTDSSVKEKFLEISRKQAEKLTSAEKEFLLNNFFMINKERVIAMHPRYYELYFKKQEGGEFNAQDLRDLQAWFNLAWTDPYFRENIPELKSLTRKARFFTEDEKNTILDKQLEILRGIIPVYKEFMDKGQIEITVSPYYHPILPLLYNTDIAKEANLKARLPKHNFAYPEDARAQIKEAVRLYSLNFSSAPAGMWPSEEAVSEHIIPLLIQEGIQWIVADEAILFKSMKNKKRDTRVLYQPHRIKRKDGELKVVFRDRNLSDLIGFNYYNRDAKDAVEDMLRHFRDIYEAFKGQDPLVTIAMDGENAWEYYENDGHKFLGLLYERIQEADFIKTTTVTDYLKSYPSRHEIKRLAAGSWIYADFFKWIGSPQKNKAWEYLSDARKELESVMNNPKKLPEETLELAKKQLYIAEGSDWFWWYDEGQKDFDELFRLHLSNFYKIIGKEAPIYLKAPISA